MAARPWWRRTSMLVMDAGPLSEREATTVMFTDIVGLTASMALLGDQDGEMS